jgi:polysaccharide pyruvyl transferase WcaK-like protein
MTAIETLVAKNGFHIEGTSAAHENWETNQNFMRALDNARLVIVNGEGTIHHDRPAGRQLLRIGRCAKERGIPAAMINTGWEENGTEFYELLKEFTLIAARDSKSARQIRQGGLPCSIVPDLSLYGRCDRAPSSRSGGVVFSDSVDRFKAIDLERCRRAIGGKTLSIIYPRAEPLGYLKFIREGFAIRDALTPKILLDIIRVRHKLWQSDIAPFMESLSSAELLVSGRFHACTLALATGTPFVAIPSNTGKIASLIADAGLETWRADTELTPEAINKTRSKSWSHSERTAIEDYLKAANESAETLFRDLAKLA